MIWMMLLRGRQKFRFAKAEPPCMKGSVSIPLLAWTLCIGWGNRDAVSAVGPLSDLTGEEIARMEAVCEAATAAPWPKDCLVLRRFERYLRRSGAQRPEEDIAFVSEARSFVPRIIAAYKQVRS